jgi:hypothetical protein
MPRFGHRLARSCAALAVGVALMPLVSPATPASAAPTCNAGVNRHTIWTSFAASKYVTAELGYGSNLYGMVRAARDDPGPWEDWTFCSYWEGATKITYIKNEYNGRYVSAEFGRTGVDDGMLRARATSIGPWEKFRIERWGPNPSMYTIKSLTYGRYVSTELGYGGVRKNMLRARASGIGNWEKFIIPCGFPITCSW